MCCDVCCRCQCKCNGTVLAERVCTIQQQLPTVDRGGALFTPEQETNNLNVPEQTAPDSDGDQVQIIGFAISADAVMFDPDSTIVEVA